MLNYDELLDAGREAPVPCPVCTGDDEAEPCSEGCAAIMAGCLHKKTIRSLYCQARRAIHYARLYRKEEGLQGRREKACLDQVGSCRTIIRLVRDGTFNHGGSI